MLNLSWRPRRRKMDGRRIIEAQRMVRWGVHLRLRGQACRETRMPGYESDPHWRPYAIAGMPDGRN